MINASLPEHTTSFKTPDPDSSDQVTTDQEALVIWFRLNGSYSAQIQARQSATQERLTELFDHLRPAVDIALENRR